MARARPRSTASSTCSSSCTASRNGGWPTSSARFSPLPPPQQELIRALNEDDALQGLFIDAMARRLASIAEQAARVGEEKTAQEQRLLEHAARKVCAERLAQAVDREVAQAADKRNLLDAIERFIAPAAQASRKIAGP